MFQFFKIKERGSSIKKECMAGFITFLSMAYILFANPDILGKSGMDIGAAFTATAIAAIVGTLLMGLLANYPIALAPGMGMNAVFTFTICIGYGHTYQEALALVFLSGVAFLLLSAAGLRKRIINAIPVNLKKAIGAGIGLFIAFIGFQSSGIIVNNDATLVGLGDFTNPATLLAIFGLIITIVFFALKLKGAIMLGIATTAVVGVILHFCGISTGVVLPEQWIRLPAAPNFGAFIDGFKTLTWGFDIILIVFTLLFLDFFDTAGTLVTVGANAGLMNEKGELVGCERALLADATATVVGAIVGTSSTTSYVESLSGVEAGGRTGLTAVVVALLFAVSLFFSPLLGIVSSSCTAAALIMVGILMMQQIHTIEWSDLTIAIPCFFTIAIMPFAYSIALGIATGFIFYVILQICKGNAKKISPLLYVLAVLFMLYFVVNAIL